MVFRQSPPVHRSWRDIDTQPSRRIYPLIMSHTENGWGGDIFCWFSLFKAVPPMNDNDLVMKWVLITRLPTRLPPSLSPFPSFPFSSFPLLSSPHWRCATATYSSTSHGRRERKSNSCSDSHMSPPPTVEHLICVKRNRRRVRRGGVPGGAAATKVIEIRARPGKEACIVTLHRAAQLRPDRL